MGRREADRRADVGPRTVYRCIGQLRTDKAIAHLEAQLDAKALTGADLKAVYRQEEAARGLAWAATAKSYAALGRYWRALDATKPADRRHRLRQGIIAILPFSYPTDLSASITFLQDAATVPSLAADVTESIAKARAYLEKRREIERERATSRPARPTTLPIGR